jgi:hypothetical protein
MPIVRAQNLAIFHKTARRHTKKSTFFSKIKPPMLGISFNDL